MDDIEALNFDDLTAVAKLTSEPRYNDVLQVWPRGDGNMRNVGTVVRTCVHLPRQQ